MLHELLPNSIRLALLVNPFNPSAQTIFADSKRAAHAIGRELIRAGASTKAELEAAFLKDLEWSVRLEPQVYAARPLAARMAENAARLLSPVM